MAGILAVHFTGLPPAALFPLAIAACALLVFRRGKWARLAVFACLFAAYFGAKSWQIRQLPFFDQLHPGTAIPVLARGIVVSEPKAADSPRSSASCELRLDYLAPAGADGGEVGRPQPARQRVWATLRGVTALSYGDRVEIRGVLRLPAPPRNPGEFDFPAFLETKGILVEIATAAPAEVRVTGQGAGNPLVALALSCRDRIRAALTLDLLPGEAEAAGVISAMMLGTRSDAPDDLIADFKHSGTLHLFAVSGLHVGMIALVLLALFGIVRTPRRLAAVLVILALVAYAFITGLRPSAVRATIMAAILLSGTLFDRPARILNSLGAAALVILAFDPFQALAPGFQLSFAVLLAIALFTNPIKKVFAPWVDPDPFLPRAFVSRRARHLHNGGRRIADTVALSTAAWVGSLPLMLVYFHLVTPVAIAANCVLIPLAFVLIFAAVSSLVFQALALPGLGILLNNANLLLVKAISGVIGVAAAIPGGHFYVSSRPWFLRDACEIEILDIPGGGAANALRTRSGERWLLDTGGTRAYERILAPYFRHAGLNRLDGLVLSHGDADHTGAAGSVIAEYRPKVTAMHFKDLRSPGIRDAKAELSVAGLVHRQLVAGERIPVDDDSELRVLFPPEGHPATLADDNGVVLQLVGHGWKVLFTSDSGFETEKWLLANVPPEALRSDLLVTGRHGIDPGGLPEFLDAVAPRAIVTSASDPRGPGGIPASDVARLVGQGVVVLEQDATGAVRVGISPERIVLTTFLDGEKHVLPRAE